MTKGGGSVRANHTAELGNQSSSVAPECQNLTAAAEESPGSMETRCRVTLGGGDPRESATESKPPASAAYAATARRARQGQPRRARKGENS